MESSEVRFGPDGERCTATFYRPGGVGGRGSCVVMGHGVTLTRCDGIPDYAQRFAAAGFAALAFDYRHGGDSEGEPRRWVSLRRQLEDWRAAVAYVRTLEGVDQERVAVWGMSLGGGHALLTAPLIGASPLLAIAVSLDVERRMRARPWLAHTQRDFAAMLIARPEPEGPWRTTQLLDEAQATYDCLGMTHWVARCAELRLSKQTGVA